MLFYSIGIFLKFRYYKILFLDKKQYILYFYTISLILSPLEGRGKVRVNMVYRITYNVYR